MKYYFWSLAWRNLWRNKRRTYITLSSITFALLFSIMMSSYTLGMVNSLLEHSLEAYSGYLQIQTEDYEDDPSLDTSFIFLKELEDLLKTDSNVKSVVPRLETFSLVSNGSHSKGCIVSGIDLESEKMMSNPEQFLVHYYISDSLKNSLKTSINAELYAKIENTKNSTFKTLKQMQLALELTDEELNIISKKSFLKNSYLEKDDKGILVSSGLARYLRVMPGDSVILLGQGYHGMSATALVAVRGWVQLASPFLNNKLIYMSQSQAQDYLSTNSRVTSLVLNLHDPKKMLSTQKALERILPRGLVIRNWEEISPALKQQTEENLGEVKIFNFILYLILFFGIVGTMQMMLSERREEFNVLISIGMKRKYVAFVFILELVILTVVSLILGLLVSGLLIFLVHPLPITFTGEVARIMQDMGYYPEFNIASLDAYFWMQIPVVFVMVLLAIIQPIRTLLRWDIRKRNQ